jgi:hypothetical protein
MPDYSEITECVWCSPNLQVRLSNESDNPHYVFNIHLENALWLSEKDLRATTPLDSTGLKIA